MEIIKVKYRSIFKYENQQESINFDTNGYLNRLDDKHLEISFVADKQIKIEIENEQVILHNGNSVLKMQLGKDIQNNYQTEYGSVLLKCRLLSLQSENPLKLKYELYDGEELISSVYVIVSYFKLEN